MGSHNELGKKGEEFAVDHLVANGYQILERNFFHRKAEIDIIALKEDVIVAVEVKTRSSKHFGNPQDFLKPKQIERIVNTMDHYVVSNNLEFEVRFDIIAILNEKQEVKIKHFENAFYHF
ncbi:MAG: YraN family protein [Psychroserpens sp.]|nr:YraN family protein [Psychroserpens sp.]